MKLFDWILAQGGSSGGISHLPPGLRDMLEQPHAGAILRALVILGCGAVGVYLMLPRSGETDKRWPRFLGGVLATLALVFLVTTPIPAGESSIPGRGATLLWPLDDQSPATGYTFFILAFISLASAVMMITARNPVYSALWFALVLLGNSGLFLLQRADFLSAATVIVYAGAIVVTFLFVIMLAQPTGAAAFDRRSREPLLSTATGLILAAVLVGTLHYAARHEGAGVNTVGSHRPAQESIDRFAKTSKRLSLESDPHVAGLGKTLFVDHVVSVEVIGVLLLAAVVGAVLIAGHPVAHEKAGHHARQ
ncbi:MAG: NADH-quinone oxidoreductase subunit J [Planctomycetia bacterium]|nr:NADH-quinone oxidoreductase subunit J [Planctomycetia bacterium]